MSLFSMDSMASALRRSLVIVFLRKVLILFSVVIGVVKEFNGLGQGELEVVFHYEVEQSHSATEPTEILSLVDKREFCTQFGLVDHRVCLTCAVECCVREVLFVNDE